MRKDISLPELLRYQRKIIGLTQAEVAEQLHYSIESVSAWERGARKPNRQEIPQLASLLQIEPEVLLSSFERTGSETQNEQAQIQAVSLNISAMNERLDTAESIINLAWDAWFASRPRRAAWETSKLLPQLQQMLTMPYIAQYQLRIRHLIIRCHGLLGAINIDALKNDTALYHYMLAHHLAESMHDNSQSATYLALIGDTLRRQGEKVQAVSRMEQACEVAAHAEKATLGHVLQLLAYTYADMGNASDFDHTIDKTTDLLAFSSEATDSARKEFVPFEVYEIRGKASRDLGRSLAALQYLELAEKALIKDEVPPRWYAVLDISRGQAYCDAGDITTGVALASQGFTKAYQCSSLRQMNRVRKLVRKLEESQWRHEQPVANLKELLHETYLRMDPDR